MLSFSLQTASRLGRWQSRFELNAGRRSLSDGVADDADAEVDFEGLLLGSGGEQADVKRLQQLAAGLAGLGMGRPTTIQRQAVPRVLGGGDAVIAAETGSGKTLAYGVPLLCKEWAAQPKPVQWPGSIVLVPTIELGRQVERMLTAVQSAGGASVAVRHWAGRDLSDRYQFAGELPRVDVLITDPLSLRRAASRPNERLKRAPLIRPGGYVHPLLAKARRLVVDEADMLLDGHYLPIVDDVLTAYRKSGDGDRRGKQVVFAGATFLQGGRKSVSAWIAKRYPAAAWLRSQRMHCALAPIEQRWLPIESEAAQLDAMAALAAESQARHERVLVFADTIARAEQLAAGLQARGVRCQAVHGEQDVDARADAIAAFAAGELPVLVATNLLSRGIDLPGPVHVVQADFATSTIIHLHRIGRASRAGAPGRATNFYAERSKQLVDAIRAAEQASGDLNATFSRGRSFARRLKKKSTRKHHDQRPDSDDDDYVDDDEEQE